MGARAFRSADGCDRQRPAGVACRVDQRLSRNRLLARLRASCRAMMRHHEVAMDVTSVNRQLSRTSIAGWATLECAIIHTPVNVFPGHAPADLSGLGEDILGAVDRVL